MAINEKLAPQPSDTQLAGRGTRLGPGWGSSFPLQGMAFLSATPFLPCPGPETQGTLAPWPESEGLRFDAGAPIFEVPRLSLCATCQQV